MKRQAAKYHGILLIDKAKGISSHGVIARLRRTLMQKKIGHAGTLDPLASGVLVLMLGKATKTSQYLILNEKSYLTEITLGITTNTYDAEGELCFHSTITPEEYTHSKIEEAIKSFIGTQLQVPPIFSAIKMNGRTSYKLARTGVEVEIPPREITIHQISDIEIDLPKVRFHVHCSKGTYIRSLAHDIGQKLNCGAYLSNLRRTQSGEFFLEKAHQLEEITPENIEEVLEPYEHILPTENTSNE